MSDNREAMQAHWPTLAEQARRANPMHSIAVPAWLLVQVADELDGLTADLARVREAAEDEPVPGVTVVPGTCARYLR